MRKDTRKYQTSSATLKVKLIEMLWYHKARTNKLCILRQCKYIKEEKLIPILWTLHWFQWKIGIYFYRISSLMKKMKESCKLDINQSVPENILFRPEVKRKQCGGDRYYANIRAYKCVIY
jgi:hypothetical protein